MGAQADQKGRRVRGRSAEMLSGLGVVLLLLGGFGAAQGKVTPYCSRLVGELYWGCTGEKFSELREKRGLENHPENTNP